MRTGNTAPDLLHFPANGAVPNNPLLPAVLLHGALPPSFGPDAILDRYRANGWTGLWTWTVFDYHHYHPASHEALTVASGSADLILGGPGCREIPVSSGDVLVLPAGTGHCRLAATGDFTVCGAYPPGQQNPEIVRAEGSVLRSGDFKAVAATALPWSDPIHGAHGPLMSAWTIF